MSATAPTLTPDDTRLDGDDDDVVSHYARKTDITRALIDGTPIKALCGVVFVPHRDPSRFPVCARCKQVYDQISGGRPTAN